MHLLFVYGMATILISRVEGMSNNYVQIGAFQFYDGPLLAP